MNLSSELYVYPSTVELTFGTPSSHNLRIEPDADIRVVRIRCNIPSAGMIIVSGDDYYTYDPFEVLELPIKDGRDYVIRKQYLKQLHIEYTGFTPQGFMNYQKFLLNYSFVGHTSRSFKDYGAHDC